jgi:hypothetical protein
MPPGYFLASSQVVRLAASYSEGQASPYMTTDLWLNYPAVWIQPMYVFVTKWDATVPRMALHPKHKWVLGVGRKTGFYSPFWRTYYVELPDPGVEDGTYKNVRDILAAKLTIHPGPGRLVAIVPPGMHPEEAHNLPPPFDAAAAPLRTRDMDPMGVEGSPLPNRTWVDGEAEQVEVLDFGPDRFEWNERGEIVEQPLFFFFQRGANGNPEILTSVPRIGGTGPVFARRPAIAAANRPLFGSFWRLWAAHLPPGKTSLFIPAGGKYERIRAEWEGRVAVAGQVGPKLAGPGPMVAQAVAEKHALKIALEPPESECFKDDAKLATCRWLDSQQALETYLGHALQPSQITVSCPYVGYAGKPVPRYAP